MTRIMASPGAAVYSSSTVDRDATSLRDKETGPNMTIHEYVSFDDCLDQGTHLADTDDDGYCNSCGNQ